MKLISIEKVGEGFSGFIEQKNSYAEFEAQDWKVEISHTYHKKDYDDYGHFVGVMSKFDPYTFFLKETIDIEELTFEKLEELMNSGLLQGGDEDE